MKKDKMHGAACMRRIRKEYKILVVKPEGKRPLGRSWRKREDNIKIDFKE
jgi:hypothetical protein